MTRRKPATRQMKPETKAACLALFFKIESHFAHGGLSLTIRDVMRLAGVTSTASGRFYVQHLVKWRLLRYDPRTIRSIVLHPEHVKRYPQVIYQDTLKGQLEELHHLFPE